MSSIKIPLSKPDIIDELQYDLADVDAKFESIINPASRAFENTIDYTFKVCVEFLYLICDITGISYELLNILVFVVINPLLIVLFGSLWLMERSRKTVRQKPIFRVIEGEKHAV